MSNKALYDQIFREVFLLDDETLDDKDALSVENWNSLEHFTWIQRLETAFGIHISEQEIAETFSYAAGLRMLERKGISLWQSLPECPNQ